MEWRHRGWRRPKKFGVQKSTGKILVCVLWIKTASSSLVIFKRVKLSARSITHLCWCNWRHNEGKTTAAGRSLRGSSSCTKMLRLTGHLQARRNWLTFVLSWSPTLFSGYGPVELPNVPWTIKAIECSPFVFDADVIAATVTWLDGQHSEFFWVAC